MIDCENEKSRYHISFPKFVFLPQQDTVSSQHANTSSSSTTHSSESDGALVQDTGSYLQTCKLWKFYHDWYRWSFFSTSEKKKGENYHRLMTDGKTQSFKSKEQNIHSDRNCETMWCDWKCTLTVDVTDLSGTSRGVLPPPARGAAFELLLAVMFVCTPPTHLMDKHKDVRHWKSCSAACKHRTHGLTL